MRVPVLFLIGALILVSLNNSTLGSNYPKQLDSHSPQQISMPNVIFMIGDGMGSEQIRAASLVEYGVEFGTIMDTQFPFSTTYLTEDIYGDITDSAASGSSIATGRNTVRKRISQSPDGKINYKTILEYLNIDFGYKVGIVTTTDVAHATPAVFGSHTGHRDNKDSILAQMLTHDLSVYMGGGLSVSYIGSENVARTLGSANGFEVAINRLELLELNGTSERILGIFPESNLPYEFDRNIEMIPSLTEMTSVAVNTLNSETTPFFLMVEGGRIDHAGHLDHLPDEINFNNKTAKNILETIAFEKAVRNVFDFAVTDGNTIVAVMGDHETGGLEILDFTNLDSILPSENNSYKENRALRVERALQLNVSWLHTSHTHVPIKFFGYGASFDKYKIEHVSDIFWAVNAELGSFPVVYEHSAIMSESVANVNFIIRDLDGSATDITIMTKTIVDDEIISTINNSVSLAFTDTFANITFTNKMEIGQILSFKAFITDIGNREITSLDGSITYDVPEPPSTSTDEDDSKYPIFILLISFVIVTAINQRKKKN